MEKRFHFSLFDNAVLIKSVIIICFLSFLSAKAFSQASVSTDQQDYPPGSTVYITGSGFAANETVTLQVLHVGGGDDLTSPAHQPWTVTVDGSGNISSTWYVPTDEDEVGATLQLTATGQTSGLIAQVTFTDAQPKPIISYTTPNIFKLGVAITPLNPTNSGGPVTGGYSISPALPSGLSIDAGTGVISGTPTVTSAATNYTVTATNSGGSGTFVVSIAVVVAAPVITYTTPNTFVVGTAITTLNPSNTGSPVTGGYSVSPTLPSGLLFNTTSGAITGTPTAVAAAANYTVTATNAGGSGTFAINIKVNPAKPNISYTTPNTFVVGTAISALSPTNTGGAAATYSISPALPSGLSIDGTTGIISGTPSAVSTTKAYTVTATNVTGSGTFVVSITVNPALPSITYPTPDTYVYGTTIASLSPNSTGGAVASYSVSPTLPAGLSLNTSTGVITGKPAAATAAADYTVTATNITGTGTFVINITVSPRPVTVTASGGNKVYDGTTTATVNLSDNRLSGDKLTFTYTANFVDQNVGQNKTVNVTNIAINGGADAANYVLANTTTTSVANISPRSLTITANNQSKTYGTAQSLGTSAFTTSTLYDSDNVTGVTLTSSGSAASAAVGIYDIVPSAAIGSGLTNYNISYVNGKDTVKVAPLTITANNQSKTYGGAQPLGTSAFTTGTLYNSDSVTGVTLTSSGSAASAAVGIYDIVPSAATGSGLTNYNISYVNGKDTVKVAPLTITAKNQSKTYGGAQPLGTSAFTTGTLYNSDSVTGVTLTSSGSTAGATVGIYDIVPSAATGSGLSNYSISYVNGKDTVKAAPLTITANNQSKVYGTTFTFAGTEFTTSTLYNSDHVNSVTLTSTGATSSAVVANSPYSIVPSVAVGSGLSNYNITYKNGTLTVTPYSDCTSYAYNGTTFANTDVGLTSTTVNLSLVITTSGGADASTAIVKFYNTSSGSPVLIGTASVTASSLNQATYSYPYKIDIGNNLSLTNTISWVVSGNYSNTTCQETSTDVTVSSRTADFLTGGGYVTLNPLTSSTYSAGTYKGDAGTKTNFGFNVKWNKTLTNIQGGGFNAIIRSGVFVYQIKAAKVATLAVTPASGSTPATAAFTSGNATVTVTNIVTGVVTNPVGNANLTVEMTDVCEPGGGSNVSSDLIAITLKDAKGALLYSNNWDGTKTVKQPLNGGNLQIHSDANTPAPTCSSSLNTVASLKNDMPISTKPVISNDLIKNPDLNPLSVTVYPNPSPNYFNISMKGGSNEKVDVYVSDVLGHLLKTYRVSSGSSITLGDNFGVGIYIVQVRQGQTFKYYRIYKAPN